MKNLIFLIGLVFIGFITSCDKVENPIKPAILLDTTLFPGNWVDYPTPTFTQNTNTNRNVVIEDFTGHRCPNCPAAGWVAKGIEDSNPERVFVASIHAGPSGLAGFQKTASDCGQASNPLNEFCTIFYCDEGITYGQTLGGLGVGFIGNPQGNLNRINFTGSDMFQFSTDWASKTNQILAENDLKVNIQAKSNYYPETNGLFLHTETEFLADLSGGQYNMTVYLLENEIEDFQDSLGVHVEEYKHHSVLRGCIDGLAWGRTVNSDYTVGSKTYLEYSYKLPDGKTNEDYHLLVYVYDVANYEILQVVKHEF